MARDQEIYKREVERTRRQLIGSLDDKIPEATQVITDLELYIRAVIRHEIAAWWP